MTSRAEQELARTQFWPRVFEALPIARARVMRGSSLLELAQPPGYDARRGATDLERIVGSCRANATIT